RVTKNPPDFSPRECQITGLEPATSQAISTAVVRCVTLAGLLPVEHPCRRMTARGGRVSIPPPKGGAAFSRSAHNAGSAFGESCRWLGRCTETPRGLSPRGVSRSGQNLRDQLHAAHLIVWGTTADERRERQGRDRRWTRPGHQMVSSHTPHPTRPSPTAPAAF